MYQQNPGSPTEGGASRRRNNRPRQPRPRPAAWKAARSGSWRPPAWASRPPTAARPSRGPG